MKNITLQIFTNNIEKSVDFFVGTGLFSSAPIAISPIGDGFVELRCTIHPFDLYILQPPTGETLSGIGMQAPGDSWLFGIPVEDVDLLRDMLIGKGMEVTDRYNFPWGVSFFYVKDPDGNLLRFESLENKGSE